MEIKIDICHGSLDCSGWWIKLAILLFSIGLPHLIPGQETPEILTYNRNQYEGGHKNWSFAEDDNGNLYVANTEGVLIFNGLNWQKVFLPHHRVPRSVYQGYDGRIYVGGFETIGYIDRTNPANPTFVDIGQELLTGTEEEIWNITGTQSQVMFQSFSVMVFKDSNGLELYQPQDNVMFGKWIEDRLYVPRIDRGLYVFEEGREWTITPRGVPPNAIVSGLEHQPDGRLLMATRNYGLFVLDSARAIPVTGEFNDQLKNNQINNLLRLQNGDYVIGTIQNGVYITSPDLQIKYHLNKSSGLANNSVLALYETKEGALCIGLNIGMNIVRTDEKSRYYYDIAGQLGTVFASIYYQNRFYVGTNQGVFVQKEDGKFSLVPGSQGQVWSLALVGDDLLCGHNSGTLQLVHGRFELVCPITGVFHMQQLNQSQLLQSTYNGLILLEKTDDRWQNARRIEGTDKLVDRFIYQTSEVIGLHPYFGLVYYRLDLSENRMIYRKIFQDKEVNIGTNTLGLVSLPEGIFAQVDSSLYRIGNYGTMTKLDAIQLDNLNDQYPDLSYRILKPINNNSAQNRQVAYFPDQNEVIRTIEEGYLRDEAVDDNPIRKTCGYYVDYVLVNKELRPVEDKSLSLKPKEQNLTMQLASTQGFLQKPANIQFRLQGYDENWRNVPHHGILEFKQLNHGQYNLQIKQDGDVTHRLFAFTIYPHWYESWPGILLYIGLTGVVFWILNQRNQNQLRLETERLKKEKEVALEAERIKARTENLEHEVAYKSKMLANSAMTMVQKNNMLNELKEVIKNENSSSNTVPVFKRKLIKLINRNLKSDESWEIFDRNFAEVHQDFIQRFTAQYPDITQSDLRLAAYIRMNMSSKEIAPILQISVRSVENKRYRLRKKMKLDSQTNLSEYLMRF